MLGRRVFGDVTTDNPAPLIDSASILSFGAQLVNEKSLIGVGKVIDLSDNADDKRCTPAGMLVIRAISRSAPSARAGRGVVSPLDR